MNSEKQVKQYTFQEKKKINDKIEKLKKVGKRKDFIEIGKLIKKALKKSDITEKNNGTWFDLSLVDNITIAKIDRHLKKTFRKYEEIIIESDSIDHTYIPYYIDPNTVKNKVGPKFSKKEKNLINRFRINSKSRTTTNETETDSEQNVNNVNNVNNENISDNIISAVQ